MKGEAEHSRARRQAVAVALVVIGAIVAIAAVLAVWLNRQVVDTNAYVGMVAPLSANAAIQDEVANSLADQMVDNPKAQQFLNEAVPGGLQFLIGPTLDAFKGYVREQLRQVIASPRFSQIWADANRSSHDMVLGALLGQGAAFRTSGDQVILDLHPVLLDLRDRLESSGIRLFDFLPLDSIDARIVVYRSPVVSQLRDGLQLLNRLAVALPLAALALLAGSVLIARPRLAALGWAGLGLAIGMVLLGLALSRTRGLYLGAVGGRAVDQQAAAALFDVVTRSLRQFGRLVLMAGVAVAAAAVLARELLSRRPVGRGSGAGGGLSGWLVRYRAPLRMATAIAGLAVLGIMSEPGLVDVIFVAGIWALVNGGVQYLRWLEEPQETALR